ncbi:MAG: Ig-like domain-containing protein [Myxococcota bacterium]
MRLPDTRALGATLVLAGIVALATPAHAQQRTIGPERCSVQLVNQVAPVARDGSWQIDNIPSTTGLTRARLYCNGPYGETRGQSPFVTVLGNRTLGLSSIFPGPMDTGPTRVSVSAQATTLTAMDETIQLETTGLYPDRSMRRIDGASFGTSYASSNPRILEVDANGVVTAKASGTAIVTAWNMGMPGTLVMLVTIGGDSDGDGLPDDYEVLVGLNPNDPLDALADSDADGLTNGEEFTLGSNPFKSDSDGDSLTDGEEARAGQDGFLTNPAAADTDSDLIPDDVEVAVGSDPTDANDTRWDLAMTGLQVRPGALYASLGPLSDGAPRRVTVMAELLGRQLVDVTAHPQTSYYIYYQYIAGLTQTPGEVVPFAQGQTPMDVGFQGYLTQIPIVVSFLVPSPIASVELPAAALDVALDGRIAYLAATTAGLLIMDVLAAPQRMFLGGLDLGARATDVERVGASRVALSLDDGSIALVDVANPRAPALLGKLDLGTTATGLSVSGTLAAVALGADGVALVDLAGPTPTPLGTLAGVNAEQVALRDGLAIVTDRVAVHDGEVHVIDVTDANAPVLRGTVIFDGGPRNVQLVDGGVGYVALYLGGDVNGLGTIDVSDPDHPTILHVGNQGNGFSLRDVAVSGDRLLASDVGQANSLIVLDRSDPRNPLFQLTIQFPGFKNSLGIDASEDLVVATAGNDFFGADDETTLLIGRFRPATTSLGPEPPVGLGGLAPPNTGGGVGGDRVKPVARITAPDNNSVHYRDRPLTVSAWASDDSGAIVQVDFLVDSNVVATLYQPPYQIELAAGTLDLLPHTFAAQATDPAGNVGRSPTTFVSVIDSPRTRVIGRVLGSDGAPIVGASVEVDGQGLVDGSELDGTFAIDAVRGVDPFMLRVRTSAIAPEETFGPFTPVPDGTTDVGVLGTSATAGERVVGEIVAEPVMVNLTRPDLAGATTFREDFTSAAAVDFRDRTSRASIVTDPGYATAPFIDFYDSGDGSTGDLVVLEGETVTLPQGSLNYADVTVYGTLKFPDGFVYMRIKGDLSGTGEIDTADANALIAVGGQMNMTLDPLNPSKPTGIHGRNEIRIELGIDHPGTSRCDMSIYTEEDESDFNGPVTLELVSNGDFLMDKSAGAFIGGLGPGNSNIARGDTVVHIAGDFSAWQVDAGASATQYQGSGKVDLDVAGDADVDHIFSAGGPARNYGHNSVTVGGDLHAIDIASYDGAGVTVAVGGSATIDHDLSTSDVAGQYASTGALDIAVNGDLSFRDAWTGSYVGSDPSQAADLGDIHVKVGGTLSIRRRDLDRHAPDRRLRPGRRHHPPCRAHRLRRRLDPHLRHRRQERRHPPRRRRGGAEQHHAGHRRLRRRGARRPVAVPHRRHRHRRAPHPPRRRAPLDRRHRQRLGRHRAARRRHAVDRRQQHRHRRHAVPVVGRPLRRQRRGRPRGRRQRRARRRPDRGLPRPRRRQLLGHRRRDHAAGQRARHRRRRPRPDRARLSPERLARRPAHPARGRRARAADAARRAFGVHRPRLRQLRLPHVVSHRLGLGSTRVPRRPRGHAPAAAGRQRLRPVGRDRRPGVRERHRLARRPEPAAAQALLPVPAVVQRLHRRHARGRRARAELSPARLRRPRRRGLRRPQRLHRRQLRPERRVPVRRQRRPRLRLRRVLLRLRKQLLSRRTTMEIANMTNVISRLAITLLAVAAAPTALAYDSGSTGADGAFEPTSSTTVTVPTSGRFDFTSIHIPAGVTVRFAGAGPVTLLASGDVLVEGVLDLRGGASQAGVGPFVALGGAPGPGGSWGGSALATGGLRGQGPAGGDGGRVVRRGRRRRPGRVGPPRTRGVRHAGRRGRGGGPAAVHARRVGRRRHRGRRRRRRRRRAGHRQLGHADHRRLGRHPGRRRTRQRRLGRGRRRLDPPGRDPPRRQRRALGAERRPLRRRDPGRLRRRRRRPPRGRRRGAGPLPPQHPARLDRTRRQGRLQRAAAPAHRVRRRPGARHARARHEPAGPRGDRPPGRRAARRRGRGREPAARDQRRGGRVDRRLAARAARQRDRHAQRHQGALVGDDRAHAAGRPVADERAGHGRGAHPAGPGRLSRSDGLAPAALIRHLPPVRSRAHLCPEAGAACARIPDGSLRAMRRCAHRCGLRRRGECRKVPGAVPGSVATERAS